MISSNTRSGLALSAVLRPSSPSSAVRAPYPWNSKLSFRARSIVGSSSTMSTVSIGRRRLELVSDIRDHVDVLGMIGVGLDLVPQAVDGLVDVPHGDEVRVAPDGAANLVLGQGAAGLAQE